MRRGFTMTEIIVVVGLIVLLAGISFPIIGKVTAKADRASCMQNLRQIGTALELYMNENNGRFPDLAMGKLEEGEEAPTLEGLLSPYLSNEEVFHCPADKELFAKSGSSYLWNTTQNGRLKTETVFLGEEGRPEIVPLVFDKESFHGETSGSNILYADYRTTNKVTFNVGTR